ncbi:hypothetical protein [Tsuneonella sp. SYSU-LHT278]|uniref:hypothetical protein n=1 Tax=Tsuneonella sediminis TaxID=3416089 RepID=UPI003F7A50A2
MAGTIDQPMSGPDRRSGDRRDMQIPFPGDEKRCEERRSGKDRRARTRYRLTR